MKRTIKKKNNSKGNGVFTARKKKDASTNS
jgi:hypothetical protein